MESGHQKMNQSTTCITSFHFNCCSTFNGTLACICFSIHWLLSICYCYRISPHLLLLLQNLLALVVIAEFSRTCFCCYRNFLRLILLLQNSIYCFHYFQIPIATGIILHILFAILLNYLCIFYSLILCDGDICPLHSPASLYSSYIFPTIPLFSLAIVSFFVAHSGPHLQLGGGSLASVMPNWWIPSLPII